VATASLLYSSLQRHATPLLPWHSFLFIVPFQLNRPNLIHTSSSLQSPWVSSQMPMPFEKKLGRSVTMASARMASVQAQTARTTTYLVRDSSLLTNPSRHMSARTLFHSALTLPHTFACPCVCPVQPKPHIVSDPLLENDRGYENPRGIAQG
jgi:hypothetical protein